MNKLSSQPLVLSLLTAAMLAGCSLTPTYTRPQAPVSATYPASYRAEQQSMPPAVKIGWRSFFVDPRLQGLIATSIANNRDLRVATLRIEEARAQYNIHSADSLPTLNAAASGSRVRTPSTLTNNGNSSNSSRYDVGLSLAAFELDFFGRVRSLNDAALSQYLATENAQQAAQISLVAEVAKAYLAERAFAEQHELAQKILEERNTSYLLAKKRFEAGASSALELQQGEILIQSATVSMVTLARQRIQAENALALLTGLPTTKLPQAQSLSLQNIVSDFEPGLPSELLENRPDIRAAEHKLMAANANIGAARAAFFPRISLTAGIGSASNALSGLFEGSSRSWSFTPQLVMPIFDADRNRSNLTLAEVRKNIAIAEYEKSIQSAFREVADALLARNWLDKQSSSQQSVQDAQAERLTLSEARYQNGIASLLDVLDAKRELYTAQQSVIQTRLLRLTNAIDLYRSLGGGAI